MIILNKRFFLLYIVIFGDILCNKSVAHASKHIVLKKTADKLKEKNEAENLALKEALLKEEEEKKEKEAAIKRATPNPTPVIVKQKATTRFDNSSIFTSELNFIIYIVFTDSYMLELLKKYIENNVIVADMNKKIWDYIESIVTDLYEKNLLTVENATGKFARSVKAEKINAILEELIKVFPKLIAHFEEQIRGVDIAGIKKFLADDLLSYLVYFEAENTALSQMMFLPNDILIEHPGKLRTQHVAALAKQPEKLQNLMQIILELEENEKNIKMIDIYEIQLKLFDLYKDQLHTSSTLTIAHSFVKKHVLPQGWFGWIKLASSMGYRVFTYNAVDKFSLWRDKWDEGLIKFIGINPWKEIFFDRVNNIFESMTMNANYFITGRPFVSRDGFFKPLLSKHYEKRDDYDKNYKYNLENEAVKDIFVINENFDRYNKKHFTQEEIKAAKEKALDLADSLLHSHGFFGARKNIVDFLTFNSAISQSERESIKTISSFVINLPANFYHNYSAISTAISYLTEKKNIKDRISTLDKLGISLIKTSNQFKYFDKDKKPDLQDDLLRDPEVEKLLKDKQENIYNNLLNINKRINDLKIASGVDINTQDKIDKNNNEINELRKKYRTINSQEESNKIEDQIKLIQNKNAQLYKDEERGLDVVKMSVLGSLGYVNALWKTWEAVSNIKNTYNDYKKIFAPYKNYISLQNKKITLTKKLLLAFSQFTKANGITIDLPEVDIIKRIFKNAGTRIDNAVSFSNGGLFTHLIKQHLAPATFLYDFKENINNYFNLNFDNDFVRMYGSEYTFSIIWKLIHKFIASVKILCHNAYLSQHQVPNQSVDYCVPKVVTNEIIFEAKDMCIPGVHTKKVFNNAQLGSRFNNRNMLITSPIGSGKTYSMLNILIAGYLSQIGIVPAKEATITAFDNIIQGMAHIYVPSKGDISKNMGERIFIKSLQEKFTGPVLLLLDEFFSGTMPEQALYLTKSLIANYWQNLNVIGIYTTHFPEIRDFVMYNKDLFGVKNAYIEVLQDPNNPTVFTRTHKLKFDDENGQNWWFEENAKERRHYYNKFISDEENKTLEKIKAAQLKAFIHSRKQEEDTKENENEKKEKENKDNKSAPAAAK